MTGSEPAESSNPARPKLIIRRKIKVDLDDLPFIATGLDDIVRNAKMLDWSEEFVLRIFRDDFTEEIGLEY